MNFTIVSRFALYTSIVLIIIISILIIRSSAKSWIAYINAGDPPPNGFKEAIAIDENNSQYYFLLGQYYLNYDLPRSQDQVYNLYRKALELNPFNYNYWYYLAEFLSDEGKREKALFALNHATATAPGVVALRWNAGMLASKLGDEKAQLNNLGSVIANDRNRRQKAFILLWQSIRNGYKIQEIITNDALPDYLHYLISTYRVSEAKIIWDRLLSSNIEISRDLFLRYVSFLIQEHEIDRAKKAWVKRFGNWEGIWNGNFKDEIMNGGFDWRIRQVQGAAVTIENNPVSNSRSMKIEFDGIQNVDFNNLVQIVPVDVNSIYRLSSTLKSKELSLGNGLYWEVSCPEINRYLAKTDQVLGTMDLYKATTTFEVPQDCNVIAIRLRSYKDKTFDRNISGTVWIDNVVLEKVR